MSCRLNPECPVEKQSDHRSAFTSLLYKETLRAHAHSHTLYTLDDLLLDETSGFTAECAYGKSDCNLICGGIICRGEVIFMSR